MISAALISEILMREGLDLLAGLYPHCFGRENRRPLKVGICEEVIAQHPEMSRHRIKRLLKEYTQHELYWSTLKAGTPRIGLDGNVAGEVTLEDEQHVLFRWLGWPAAPRPGRPRYARPPPRPLKNAPNNRNRLPRKNLDSRRRLDHLVSVLQASRPPL